MIIGEAPGETEIYRNSPFFGPSGACLDSMLHEAGFIRTQCFVTNVCTARPPKNDISHWISSTKKRPDTPGAWVQYKGKWLLPQIVDGIARLEKEIELCKPELIIALGNLPLWILTEKWGITDWRGSQMKWKGIDVVPTYHPAAVLRQWDWRAVSVLDLRRAKRVLDTKPAEPQYNFLVRPSFEQACEAIDTLIWRADLAEQDLEISVDIETRWGHIACLGLAWSRLDAVCIPFMCIENKAGYWSAEEESAIVYRLYKLLTHPRVGCVGQNLLYDYQYIYRHWHFIPNFRRDTMLAHHLCFPGIPKGLDFLSSMYCDYHVFWKAESKDWHYTMQEDMLWTYNCKDCVITYECDEEIMEVVTKLGLDQQPVEGLMSPFARQMELFQCALTTMIKGIRANISRRKELQAELLEALTSRENWIESVIGHKLNLRSPLQMKRFFYEDLQQKEVRHKKTKQPTLDDNALDTIARREPILAPLITVIRECRSIGVFLSTFVNAELDIDGRIRCSFNPAGTETFRFSSSTNAFNSGMNLQNIPKGSEDD